MNPTGHRDLLDRLGVLRRQLRRGRFFAALGFVAAGALGFVLVAGLSDFFAGWETPARLVLVGLGLALLAAATGLAWRRACATPLAEVARRADRSTGDARRGIAAAVDLADSADDGEESPLHRHLAGLAVARARERLASVPAADLLPAQERRAPWRRALAALLVVGLVVAIHPRAAAVVASRLARPWAELAPYSPWRFDFGGGETPAVIYGKEADLSVRISGPPSSAPVELLLRPADGGEAERLPTFRESGMGHSRKIEGVTRPLEFAFAIGRARSEWRRLEVLYQPRLESASIETKPPAYSRLAGARFDLGTGDLRALRGTAVRLVAVSNRPLSGGSLEGRAPAGATGGEVLRRVEAASPEPGATSAVFDWRVEEDLVWTLDLVDVRGGRMEEPVLFVQQLVPDEKPEVSLVEPGPFVFATPESELRFVWEASDDFGLDRLDLVRSAGRFRERAASLPGGAGEKLHRVEQPVSLASLGVRPGQTLEYLVEARDRNPSLLGVSASPATKVQIISEEEYAAGIRLRTTLEEFAARYRALRETLESVLESLEALAAAPEGDAREEALRRAAAAHREAIEWFGAFAEDFPAFATDPLLNELSGGLRDELEANLAELGDPAAASDPAKAAALAEQLAARLRPGAGKLAEEAANAERLVAIASVMEMAAEIEAIHGEQRDLSERLGRLAREMALGQTDNRNEVPGLRARQMRNRERLARIEAELPDRLEQLPEEAAPLREGAEKVLEQLRTLEVSGQMGESVDQAGEGKVPGAAAAAALALANLDQILAKGDDDFSRICQGGTPGFCSGDGVAAQALAQMLGALRQRAAQGGGSGPGGDGGMGLAFGAVGGSGSAMQGIQLDVPLIGPPRVQLSRPPSGGGGRSEPGREGKGGDRIEETDEETLPVGEAAGASGQGWSPEDVPAKYRRAVTRFFSDESDSAPADSPQP